MIKVKSLLKIGLAAVGGFAGWKVYKKISALKTAKSTVKALLLSDKPGSVIDDKWLTNLSKDYISGNLVQLQGDAALLVSQGYVYTAAAFQLKINEGNKGKSKAVLKPAVKK